LELLEERDVGFSARAFFEDTGIFNGIFALFYEPN